MQKLPLKRRISRYFISFGKYLIPQPKQAAELFVYYVAGTISTTLALIIYSLVTHKILDYLK